MTVDYKLLVGDNVAVLREHVADNSVQLTITSPPYDNLRKYNGYSWDFESVARELYRVTKPGGVVVWVVADATVNGSETGTSFRQALFFRDVCGFNLHDTMIWSKGGFTAVGTLRTRYGSVFEYMFVLSKGSVKTFNPLKDRPNKTVGARNHGTARQPDGTTKPVSCNSVRQPYGQRFNIWKFPNPGVPGQQHPAVFPEAIPRDHILSWSNPGDLVLDPFLGSGTTGKMALLNGRRFIGCDISPAYVDLAAGRIRKALNLE